MLTFVVAAFTGWTIGSNAAGNVFGPAVMSRMLRYRTATILCSLFVVIGAVAESSRCIATLGAVASQTSFSALLILAAAGITTLAMTAFGIPVPTSQAVLGAIIAAGMFRGDVQWNTVPKIVGSWIATPICAALLAGLLFPPLSKLHNYLRLDPFTRHSVIRTLLIATGIYGSYALGANNAANIGAVLVRGGLLPEFEAALLAGVVISLGVLTYAKKVMITVGQRLVSLDMFSAFVVVLAESLTMHAFAMLGTPVSSSHAVVGALLGVGMFKSVRTINARMVWQIGLGWVCSPAIAFAVTTLGMLSARWWGD